VEDKDIIEDLIKDNDSLRKRLKYEREVVRPNMLEIVKDECIKEFQKFIELSLLNIECIIQGIPEKEAERIKRHIYDIRFLFRKREFEKERKRREANEKV
jgi:hypothetical protein